MWCRCLLFFLYWMSVCGVRAQTDSMVSQRIISSSTMIGVGRTNLLDTYLSPLEYTGIEARVLYEQMRRTKMMEGKVHRHLLFQLQLASTQNISQTARAYSGLLNAHYALLYKKPLTERWDIYYGAHVEGNVGGAYNERNSNNPGQVYAYGSFGASGMLNYRFQMRKKPFQLRYQVTLPLIGARFSPEYGESYYELYELKHSGQHVKFITPVNAYSLRQMLSLDFPIGRYRCRVGYLFDMQQSRLNQLKTHTYSHLFMIGVIRDFYLLDGRKAYSSTSTAR